MLIETIEKIAAEYGIPASAYPYMYFTFPTTEGGASHLQVVASGRRSEAFFVPAPRNVDRLVHLWGWDYVADLVWATIQERKAAGFR